MSFFVRIFANFKARFASRASPPEPRRARLQPWLDKALERLQEDEGLTADLTDEAAQLLLRYAAEQVTRMAANSGQMDEVTGSAALEERFTALRTTLRQIAGECARAADPQAALTQRLENLTIDPGE